MIRSDVRRIASADPFKDVRERQEWCRRWLERQHVRNPAITPEWRNLLDDSVALLAENERLREALRDRDTFIDQYGHRAKYDEYRAICAALAAPSETDA
jgi:hypothetical protein